MPRKTYKLRRNRRKTAKRGGLFGFSTHADKDESGENVKNIYKLEVSIMDGAQVLKIIQKKAKLGNIWGIKSETETHIGNLFVGSIFYAKEDRSMTARLQGSNKYNAHEDNNRTAKNTYLSKFYNRSGLKSLASYARIGTSFGKSFATGRWPETGFYIVTSINSNGDYGWFSCSRLEYIVSSNSKKIKTIHDIIKTNDEDVNQADDDKQKQQLESIKKAFNNNNNKCSFTYKDTSCDIGLSDTSLTINNSNENFLDNIGFIIQTPNSDDKNMALFDFIKDLKAAPGSQPQLSIFGENGGKSKKQILYILLAMKLKANALNPAEFFDKIKEIEPGTQAQA
jgi:hypothetical protein